VIRRAPRTIAFSLLALLALGPGFAGCPPAFAQGPEPAPEYFTPGGSWIGRWHLSPYGDLRLRYDRVSDRPGATEDLERVRGRLRAGLVWSPHPRIALEAGLYSGLWRADFAEAAAPFDNEHDDSVAVDRVAAVFTGANATIALGKRPLPLAMTDLTWDADLRPVGVSLVARRAVREFDEARLAAAAVRRAEPDGEEVLLAAQLAYAVRPGAARGGEVLIGIESWSDLDEVARDGLGRQNRLVLTGAGPQFARDFRLIELQASARTRLGAVPWSVALHGVSNVEAHPEGRGFRASTRFGVLEEAAHVELGYVFQVIERDAVPGAFNSDDWWFHSRASGHRGWLAVRPIRWATARLSMFDERRDDVAKRTRRLLFDLELELPRE
jgi:hypothetical protein